MRPIFRRASVVGACSALVMAGIVAPQALAATPRATLDAAPAWTSGAKQVGETPASAVQRMSVVLKLRDAAGADALANAVSNPASASYGHYVSAAQWRSKFAPTDAEVASVVAWLKAQGFAIGAIPANHRTVSFTGTSAQAEAAFATNLKVFVKDGQQVSAPASSTSVPSALAAVVAGVSGLDRSAQKTPSGSAGGGETPATSERKQSKAANVGTTAAKPADTLPPPPDVYVNSGPCSTYYGEKLAAAFPQILQTPLTYVPCGYKPDQLRGAYGETGTAHQGNPIAQGYDGRGVTVAIVDAYASPTIVSDATTWAKRNDPTHPIKSYSITQSTPPTYTDTEYCAASGWYGEETLDVEAVHTTAPGAKILYVGGSSCFDDDLDSAVNTVVDNQLAQVITNSYADTGEPTSTSGVADERQTLMQAAAEGISVMFSSGDDGDNTVLGAPRSVDYEASDPFATAVGGTSLAIGKDNDYLFETGWSTASAKLVNGQWTPTPPAYLYGGGGGTSDLFKQPGYQKGVVPTSISEYSSATPHRAVPDVAMDADPNTGFLIGETQTFPSGSAKYSEYRLGGTSLASPLFAGITAVADQGAGRALGFLNPLLYKLAGSSAFHDIVAPAKTLGVVRVNYVNSVDATGGLSYFLRTLGTPASIFARPGYDDVTGVGTPNGAAFFYAMATGNAPSSGTGHGGSPTSPRAGGTPTR